MPSDVVQPSPLGEDIEGINTLSKCDQAIVRQYLVNNSEQGVDDERVALNDSHFEKREIMPAKLPSKKLTVPLLRYQKEALAWYYINIALSIA